MVSQVQKQQLVKFVAAGQELTLVFPFLGERGAFSSPSPEKEVRLRMGAHYSRMNLSK